MTEGEKPREQRPRRSHPSSPMRVVPPPRPGPSPTVAIGALIAILVALSAAAVWFAHSSPAVPPSVAPSIAEAPTSEVPPELTRARELSLEVRRVLDQASDAMAKDPHAVKSPYPWGTIPDRYKEIVRTVRGKPFERDFWLEHTRMLAVAIARLSAAVSADPDNPDAPQLLTVANDNARSKNYDAVIRQVAEVMKGPESIHKLMEICFLIVSGDTNQATAATAKLPPLAPGEANRFEEVCRHLARTLLAYGTKKGAKPLDRAREGLALVRDRTAPTLEEWQWALILVYASVPSLFHEDFGKKEAGQDVVDRGLALLGRTGTRPPFFAQLDPAMLGEVRRVIRDAGKRGMGFLGPDAGAQPPPPVADLVLGASTARWMITAADPGREEAQLWYGIFLNWLTPATPALTAAGKDPTLARMLAELDAVAAARAKADPSGVMEGIRARLALIRGDPAAASSAAQLARSRADQAGYRTSDETVWEALERLAVEIKKPVAH